MPISGPKRALAFAVLVALVWQFVQFASFEYRRVAVQREVKLKLKAGVPASERAYFTFSQAEYDALHWLKPEKEFSMGTGFFDVIEKTFGADGMIHLACMNDAQEEALFADLATLVAQNMDQRGAGADALLTVVLLAKHWCTQDVSVPLPQNAELVLHVPLRMATLMTGHAATVWLPPRA